MEPLPRLVLSSQLQRRLLHGWSSQSSETFSSPANLQTEKKTSRTTRTTKELLPPPYSKTEFGRKVAVVDADGSFLYEDIFRRYEKKVKKKADQGKNKIFFSFRSAELSSNFRGLLNSPEIADGGRQPRVGLVCPNGASFVIAQWAAWMSGASIVPMATEDNNDGLRFVINESNCDLVVTTEATVDRVNDICKEKDRPLIALDATWTANPKQEFDDVDVAPKLPLLTSPTALIVFTRAKNRRMVEFSHEQILAQSKSVATAWNMDATSTVLHSLPLNHPYGVVSALSAPLRVGGKVVMLSQFDTIKVWSLLLGIGPKDKDFAHAKVNFFPTLPHHVSRLLDRYRTVFEGKKAKEYVKYTCKKRLRGAVSSCGPISPSKRHDWFDATGVPLANCLTLADAGTILSSDIKDKSESGDWPDMKALPGVKTRIVRKRYDTHAMEILDENAKSAKTCVGKLFVKSEFAKSNVANGWTDTGKNVKMTKGKFEVLK